MARLKNAPESRDAKLVPVGELDVLISTITRDPAYQCREKLNEEAIRQMAAALRANQRLPSVRVMRVDGVAFLADGWHRVKAHIDAGKDLVRAVVEEGTVSSLRRAVATANLRHGTRPSRADMFKMFEMFIAGRGHREADGSIKSAHKIAADLGGMYSHVTVLDKLKKYHPKIHAELLGDKTDERRPESDPLMNTSRLRARAARSALDNAWEEMRGVTALDLESREQIRDQLNELLRRVQTLGGKDLDQLRAENPVDEFDVPFESVTDAVGS